MKHAELVNFIKDRMHMQHIYQPLVLRTLVESGGSATIRQLSQAVLSLDEVQLRYYEERIKVMPVRVLNGHGVIEKNGDLISLTTKRMTLEQKSELLLLCEQKMREFIQREGIEIWDSRYVSDSVPSNLRYEALKRANKRCELCVV